MSNLRIYTIATVKLRDMEKVLTKARAGLTDGTPAKVARKKFESALKAVDKASVERNKIMREMIERAERDAEYEISFRDNNK